MFTETLELDLSTVVPSIAGPKRPQDRVALKDAATAFNSELTRSFGVPANDVGLKVKVEGTNYELTHGDVVIAAITELHQHLQPLGADRGGPRRAQGPGRSGLTPKPWGEDLARPGVAGGDPEYLDKSGLSADLDAVGFNTVGLRLHHLHRQTRGRCRTS